MDTLKWKRRIGAVVPPQFRQRDVILLYHSIGEGRWCVREAEFRKQLTWLREQATVVSLQSVHDEPGRDGLRVAITFDDGYASLYDRAAPLLAEYGFTATVFLNTGCIAQGTRQASDPGQGHYPGEPFMTWEEALALGRAGWTLGSHAVHHVDLTRLDAVALAGELADSKAEIEQRSSRSCTSFAYPWGRLSDSVRAAVSNAGYRCAVSGLHGPVRPSSDPYALPRIDVRAEYALRDFEAVVRGRWDFLGWRHRWPVRAA